MSQTVTVYTSEDAGAPQLTNQKPSEIIDILKKCLVDGYGAKSPLGWTMPYQNTGTRQVVFRNNIAAGGSGGYVKFYSNSGTDNPADVMRVTSAVSMSGINSYFNRGFTQAFRTLQYLGSPQFTVNKWLLIGTPLAFYFIMNMNTSTLDDGTNEQPIVFVGDFYSALANDTGRFITITNPGMGDIAEGSSATLNNLASNISTSTTCLKIYDADGHTTPNNYCFHKGLPNIDQISQTGFNIEITSEHVLYPIMIVRQYYNISGQYFDRFGVLAHISSVSPSTRGVLPGICVSNKPGYQGFAWPVIREINTHDHLLFRSSISGPCNLWLNIEVWDDPFGNV